MSEHANCTAYCGTNSLDGLIMSGLVGGERQRGEFECGLNWEMPYDEAHQKGCCEGRQARSGEIGRKRRARFGFGGKMRR
ncbi:MAG: hypothetical protein ACLRSW_06435 [Christensenellaceae bacterium]